MSETAPQPAIENEVTTAKEKLPIEYMNEARDFFAQRFSISIDETGHLTQPVSPEQIEQLRQWRRETFAAANGVDMPTRESFYQRTLAAVAFSPQHKDDKIQYLFGKGQGTEVALQGTAVGRIIKSERIPYRSHSDFDLYGMDESALSNYQGNPIFGGQEYYPSAKTKGLSALPEGFLHATAQTINLGGVEVLVPELELLFLDKLMKQETTPRQEGIDAFLLAKKYQLDAAKLHDYAEQFIVTPEKTRILAVYEGALGKQLSGVGKAFRTTSSHLSDELEHSPTVEEVVIRLNHDVATQSTPTQWYGVHTAWYVPLSSEDVDQTGLVINEDYRNRTRAQIALAQQNEIQESEQVHALIDSTLMAAETKEDKTKGELYFCTDHGSRYYLLPDGRTRRYKAKTQEWYEPQDIIVFVPNYDTLHASKPSTMSEDAFQQLFGENDVQLAQNLLAIVQDHGVNGRQWRISVTTVDGREIKQNAEKKSSQRLFLKFELAAQKQLFFIPVSSEPKIGYSPFDKRWFEKDDQHLSEQHLGNAIDKLSDKNQ